MQTKKKKPNTTKVYLGLSIALLVILAGIWAGITYWPEDKAPVAGVQEQLEENADYKAGVAFMDSIANVEGIKELGGGLYYKVIKEGNGAKPGQDSRVRVNYEGRLVDGKVFDSSYERKEPATFGVGQVITGWQIALKAMPVGSTWEIYIPYYYGYGERGSGKNIPPYSALVFKVELLGIE